MGLNEQLAVIDGAGNFRKQYFKVDDQTSEDILASWIYPNPLEPLWIDPWPDMGEWQRRARERIIPHTYTSSTISLSPNPYNLQTSEKDGLWTATIDMPGAKKSDVKIVAKKSQLAIAWKRDTIAHSTSVYVPDHVDHLSAKAKLEDGILVIRFQIFPQARETVVEVE